MPRHIGRTPRGSRTAMIASLVQEEERVGALHPAERLGDAVLEGDLLAPRDQVHEHFAVRGRLEDRALLLELGAHCLGVGQVAVVADRERALGVVDGEGLRVAQGRAAGGGVAHVADGDAARELADLLGAEDVLHQAHGAVGEEALAVAGDDAGRLLPAVLQGVEAEVGDVGGLAVAVDAEDAALVVEVVVVVCRRLVSGPPGTPILRVEDDESLVRDGGGGHSVRHLSHARAPAPSRRTLIAAPPATGSRRSGSGSRPPVRRTHLAARTRSACRLVLNIGEPRAPPTWTRSACSPSCCCTCFTPG